MNQAQLPPDLVRRLRSYARATDRALPSRVRRSVRVLAGRASDWRGQELVSVVIVAGQRDKAGLTSCVRSLQLSDYRNLDILVVLMPGAAETVLPEAQRLVGDDFRIRIVRSSQPGSIAARRLGAAKARGTFLALLRPGDQMPVTALRRSVTTLERTGSSFVFGRLVEQQSLLRQVTTVEHPAHGEPREGVRLADFPMAITDLFEENRLYRTTFVADFLKARGASSSGDGDEAGWALRAFAQDAAFDVLVETNYLRSQNSPGRSVGTVASAMSALDLWLAEQARIADFLESIGENSARMLAAWGFAVCDSEVVALLDDAERADDGQWQRLCDFLARVRLILDEETWASVRAESRVKVALALAGRREDLEAFTARRLFDLGNVPTHVEDGRVLADFGLDVPDDCRVLSTRETPLGARLYRAWWSDATTLDLHFLMRIQLVSQAEAPVVSVALVHEERSVELASEPFFEPEASVINGHRYQDYRPGGLRVRLDFTEPALAELVATAPLRPDVTNLAQGESARFNFAFTINVQGVERQGTVTAREERSSAGLVNQPLLGAHLVGERLVGLAAAPRGGLLVRVQQAQLFTIAKVRWQGRELSGTVVAAHGSTEDTHQLRGELATGMRLRLTRADSMVVHADIDPSGAFTLRLPDPAFGIGLRRYDVEVVATDGHAQLLAFPRQRQRLLAQGGSTPGGLISRTASGHVEILEAFRVLQVDSVTRTDDGVRLEAAWVGLVPELAHLTVRLASPRAVLPGTVVEASGNNLCVHFQTRVDDWGLGPTAAPPGLYRLEVSLTPPTTVSATAPVRLPLEQREPVRVVFSSDMAKSLFTTTVDATYRLTPIINSNTLHVRLQAPMLDDERGPFNQRRMQKWSANEVPVEPDVVYLQSYGGLAATDSQLAIAEELTRSRPDLRLFWGVASMSTVVPEGGTGVLMYSQEWYRVLGCAKYLVNNIDFDRWFQRKPDQRFLQTFHGYPAKSMGIRLWRAKEFSNLRIQTELARTSRDWTLILTPSPEMDVYYRTEYAYDGEIENRGYPRDDVLVGPRAEGIRADTRRRLGIADHQTVVLYAPTWRDDQATNYRSAVMTKHLDLESAAAALGDDFVFLMRGHRFHARSTERGGRSARLLDVTDYPEINDLILASDAAVLDYSSLRFDFALTQRPMLFLVPDLSSYTGDVRGFLYPFTDSAPGPLFDDAEQVVRALKDLPSVSKLHHDDLVAFNKTYNYDQDGRAAQRVVARFFV